MPRKRMSPPDYNKIADSYPTVSKAREMLNLSKVTINDFDEIRNRVFKYLTYCDENERIPTLRGVSVAIGVDSGRIKSWLKAYPEHQTSLFLKQLMDMLADDIESKALTGELDRAVSIFSLKANFDYQEMHDVTITHTKESAKSIDELESQINQEIIDVEFEEKP